MKQPKKYLPVAGARPNFMKVTPIYRTFSSMRNGHINADLLLSLPTPICGPYPASAGERGLP